MSTELTRWTSAGSIVRQGDKELAQVHTARKVALAKVMGIAEVANTAMLGTGAMSMTKRQLEAMAPEDAGKLDHLETIAVIGMGNVIQQLSYEC